MNRRQSEPAQPRPSRAKAILGEQLRALRKSSGLSGVQLAKRLKIGQATISKIETGRQAPTVEYLIGFAGAVGLSRPRLGQLLAQHRLLPTEVDETQLAKLLPFDFLAVDESQRKQRATQHLERSAKVIREYAGAYVPGLLQTESYARSVIRLAGFLSPDAVERGVRARLERQNILDSTTRLHFVLSESSLRARLCPSADMIAQLEQLIALAKRPNVRLSLVPWSARLPVWPPPSFCLYDERWVYVELGHAELSVTAESAVHTYVRILNAFESAALTGPGFVQAIERIMADFERLDDLEQLGPSIVLPRRAS